MWALCLDDQLNSLTVAMKTGRCLDGTSEWLQRYSDLFVAIP